MYHKPSYKSQTINESSIIDGRNVFSDHESFVVDNSHNRLTMSPRPSSRHPGGGNSTNRSHTLSSQSYTMSSTVNTGSTVKTITRNSKESQSSAARQHNSPSLYQGVTEPDSSWTSAIHNTTLSSSNRPRISTNSPSTLSSTHNILPSALSASVFDDKDQFSIFGSFNRTKSERRDRSERYETLRPVEKMAPSLGDPGSHQGSVRVQTTWHPQQSNQNLTSSGYFSPVMTKHGDPHTLLDLLSRDEVDKPRPEQQPIVSREVPILSAQRDLRSPDSVGGSLKTSNGAELRRLTKTVDKLTAKLGASHAANEELRSHLRNLLGERKAILKQIEATEFEEIIEEEEVQRVPAHSPRDGGVETRLPNQNAESLGDLPARVVNAYRTEIIDQERAKMEIERRTLLETLRIEHQRQLEARSPPGHDVSVQCSPETRKPCKTTGIVTCVEPVLMTRAAQSESRSDFFRTLVTETYSAFRTRIDRSSIRSSPWQDSVLQQLLGALGSGDPEVLSSALEEALFRRPRTESKQIQVDTTGGLHEVMVKEAVSSFRSHIRQTQVSSTKNQEAILDRLISALNTNDYDSFWSVINKTLFKSARTVAVECSPLTYNKNVQTQQPAIHDKATEVDLSKDKPSVDKSSRSIMVKPTVLHKGCQPEELFCFETGTLTDHIFYRSQGINTVGEHDRLVQSPYSDTEAIVTMKSNRSEHVRQVKSQFSNIHPSPITTEIHSERTETKQGFSNLPSGLETKLNNLSEELEKTFSVKKQRELNEDRHSPWKNPINRPGNQPELPVEVKYVRTSSSDESEKIDEKQDRMPTQEIKAPLNNSTSHSEKIEPKQAPSLHTEVLGTGLIELPEEWKRIIEAKNQKIASENQVKDSTDTAQMDVKRQEVKLAHDLPEKKSVEFTESTERTSIMNIREFNQNLERLNQNIMDTDFTSNTQKDGGVQQEKIEETHTSYLQSRVPGNILDDLSGDLEEPISPNVSKTLNEPSKIEPLADNTDIPIAVKYISPKETHNSGKLSENLTSIHSSQRKDLSNSTTSSRFEREFSKTTLQNPRETNTNPKETHGKWEQNIAESVQVITTNMDGSSKSPDEVPTTVECWETISRIKDGELIENRECYRDKYVSSNPEDIIKHIETHQHDHFHGDHSTHGDFLRSAERFISESDSSHILDKFNLHLNHGSRSKQSSMSESTSTTSRSDVKDIPINTRIMESSKTVHSSTTVPVNSRIVESSRTVSSTTTGTPNSSRTLESSRTESNTTSVPINFSGSESSKTISGVTSESTSSRITTSSKTVSNTMGLGTEEITKTVSSSTNAPIRTEIEVSSPKVSGTPISSGMKESSRTLSHATVSGIKESSNTLSSSSSVPALSEIKQASKTISSTTNAANSSKRIASVKTVTSTTSESTSSKITGLSKKMSGTTNVPISSGITESSKTISKSNNIPITTKVTESSKTISGTTSASINSRKLESSKAISSSTSVPINSKKSESSKTLTSITSVPINSKLSESSKTISGTTSASFNSIKSESLKTMSSSTKMSELSKTLSSATSVPLNSRILESSRTMSSTTSVPISSRVSESSKTVLNTSSSIPVTKKTLEKDSSKFPTNISVYTTRDVNSPLMEKGDSFHSDGVTISEKIVSSSISKTSSRSNSANILSSPDLTESHLINPNNSFAKEIMLTENLSHLGSLSNQGEIYSSSSHSNTKPKVFPKPIKSQTSESHRMTRETEIMRSNSSATTCSSIGSENSAFYSISDSSKPFQSLDTEHFELLLPEDIFQYSSQILLWLNGNKHDTSGSMDNFPPDLNNISSILIDWWVDTVVKLSAIQLKATIKYLIATFSKNLVKFLMTNRDKQGNTCLHYVIGQQLWQTFSILHGTGLVEPDLYNFQGYTVMMLASIIEVTPDILSTYIKILAMGAKLNLQSKHQGQTALFLAALNDNDNTILLLSSLGADVNLADNDGNTPLIIAVMNNKIKSVRAMLRCPNILTDLRNKVGSTALAVAESNHYVDIISLLKSSQRVRHHSEVSSFSRVSLDNTQITSPTSPRKLN